MKRKILNRIMFNLTTLKQISMFKYTSPTMHRFIKKIRFKTKSVMSKASTGNLRFFIYFRASLTDSSIIQLSFFFRQDLM